MNPIRRPISLIASLSFGLGSALLLLLLAASGATPAAAAPAHVGPNPPLPANCHARNDSNTLLVYDSADSLAVRLAVAAALPNDIVRLAGTCAGVAAGGGTTQTVLINKVLTLQGGYTPTDWADSFPLTQPTTLDALNQGRVITASGDLTITDLTVQNGNSAGGDGGGIWDGHDLTALGAVSFLSNTTLVSTTLDGVAAPVDTVGDGGGGWANGRFNYDGLGRLIGEIENNSAARDGGCFDAPQGQVDFDGLSRLVRFNRAGRNGGCIDAAKITIRNLVASNNSAQQAGGFAHTTGDLNAQNSNFRADTANVGADWWSGGQIDIGYTSSSGSHANVYGGFGAIGGGHGSHFSHVTVSNDFAGAAGGGVYSFASYDTWEGGLFLHNQAADGAALFISSSFVQLINTVAIGNLASNKGNAIYGLDFLGNHPNWEIINSNFLNSSQQFALDDQAGARPWASTAISPGAAIFVDGATLFMTDTIVGGYATDLALGANPSTTVHEDYNLFENTPVFSGTVITGGHSLVGNPLFADSLGHLSAGSPAIDHGIDVGINVDFDGNHRPSGHGFDIGAYEYVAAMLKLFLPLVWR